MDQFYPQSGPTPQTNEPANQANPEADKAALEQQLLQSVFDGKYKSVEDARRGYWELNNYASQAYQALNQRVDPAMTAAQRQSAFDQLEEESLVKKDLLKQAIREEAGQLLENAFAPLQQAARARQELQVTAPEYIQNETAIMGWLQNNPQAAHDVARLNQAGLYDLAGKTALNYWRASNPPADSGSMAAKQQAALPNQNAQLNRQVEPSQNQDILAQAIAYGHRTGDKRAAYSMLFPEFKVQLPPHIAAELRQ